jgi:hypothetical protein
VTLRGGIEEFRLAGELARRIYGLENMKFTHQHNAPRSKNGAWKFKLNSNGGISELIGCAERCYDGKTTVENGRKIDANAATPTPLNGTFWGIFAGSCSGEEVFEPLAHCSFLISGPP